MPPATVKKVEKGKAGRQVGAHLLQLVHRQVVASIGAHITAGSGALDSVAQWNGKVTPADDAGRVLTVSLHCKGAAVQAEGRRLGKLHEDGESGKGRQEVKAG